MVIENKGGQPFGPKTSTRPKRPGYKQYTQRTRLEPSTEERTRIRERWPVSTYSPTKARLPGNRVLRVAGHTLPLFSLAYFPKITPSLSLPIFHKSLRLSCTLVTWSNFFFLPNLFCLFFSTLFISLFCRARQ